MDELNELIGFLSDAWERREPDPIDELAEDLGAFLQEGESLAVPLSSLLTMTQPLPAYTIR